MKRLVTSLLALSLGFGGSIAAFKASDTAIQSETQGVLLGNLDFVRYCIKQYEQVGTRSTAVLVRRDIYGWMCANRRNGLWGTVEIDTDSACRLLFGGPAHADAYDVNWPYSWQCFRGLQK